MHNNILPYPGTCLVYVKLYRLSIIFTSILTHNPDAYEVNELTILYELCIQVVPHLVLLNRCKEVEERPDRPRIAQLARFLVEVHNQRERNRRQGILFFHLGYSFLNRIWKENISTTFLAQQPIVEHHNA